MTFPVMPHPRRELSAPPDFFMAKSRSRPYLRLAIGAQTSAARYEPSDELAAPHFICLARLSEGARRFRAHHHEAAGGGFRIGAGAFWRRSRHRQYLRFSR